MEIEDDNFLTAINDMTMIGLSVSLVALIISLFILFTFTSFTSSRIIVHINMFAAMALNNISWLVWYEWVHNPDALYDNEV